MFVRVLEIILSCRSLRNVSKSLLRFVRQMIANLESHSIWRGPLPLEPHREGGGGLPYKTEGTGVFSVNLKITPKRYFRSNFEGWL